MTLLEIENRIRAAESTLEENDPALRILIRDHINEAYRFLSAVRPWVWLHAEETLTASDGDTYLDLPADFLYLIDLFGPDGEPMEPRTAQRQDRYVAQIESLGNLYTYSIAPYDPATQGKRLRLVPGARAGDHLLRYTMLPPVLTNDDDEPLGPPAVSDYLFWEARGLRLLTHEERPSLIQQTQQRAEAIKTILTRENETVLRSMKSYTSPER